MGEMQRCYQINKTIIEMLVDRGYTAARAEVNMTLHEFEQRFWPNGSEPSREDYFRIDRKRDSDEQIFVYFPREPKIGCNKIAEYYTNMKQENTQRAILVLQEGLTTQAKKAIQMLDGVSVEVFKETELLVNITRHELVPEHTILSEQEKLELLSRYKVKPTQLPRIKEIDPVARYYGLKKGDIVKIRRRSETAGRYVTYRYVI
eukprot:TRINITY_DN10355_c0_g1_i1.p1 TRINITY_DN10355_c0_g1~~TRINITY_DN10355_c0_g1_i1.p1  ORF type:complete len:204 (-),score=48.92 TRINITY_DN10355_c0_g1_i1:41-652(-)